MKHQAKLKLVHGELINSPKIKVGERIISADKILIATGRQPWRTASGEAGLSITPNEAFNLDALPGRVVVIEGEFEELVSNASAGS